MEDQTQEEFVYRTFHPFGGVPMFADIGIGGVLLVMVMGLHKGGVAQSRDVCPRSGGDGSDEARHPPQYHRLDSASGRNMERSRCDHSSNRV